VNGDWTFAFKFPEDGLALRRIVTPAGRFETHPPAFKVGSGIVNPDAEEDDQVRGRLIYTNYAVPNSDGDDSIEIEYTLQITDPAEFDAMFLSALAWRLAALLAPSIAQTKEDPQICTRAQQNYELDKQRAQAAARNESQDEPNPDAEWIRARNGECTPGRARPWEAFPSA
jgi:hypothetical protein